MINSILDDIWFGKIGEHNSDGHLDLTEQKLLEILTAFQQGNFGRISELPMISRSSSNSDIRRFALRLFLSASNHSDIALLNDMLDETSESDVNDFCYYSESSLSLQTLPYLLALFETWEGTDVGELVCQTIGYTIDSLPAQDGDCSLDELAYECKSFLSTHDQEKYYYAGNEFFVGSLTKQLVSEVMICRAKARPYFSDQVPSILSIVTGIKCPVRNGTQITDIVLKKIMHYINVLSSKNWIPGCKYFYGHIVENH